MSSYYRLFCLLLLIALGGEDVFFQFAHSQALAPLTVEKIMRDPQWMGAQPRNVFWSEDSKYIYFNWNPEGAQSDSLYVVGLNAGVPRKLSRAERQSLPSRFGVYNRDRTKKLYTKEGDIFLLAIGSGTVQQITNTVGKESSAIFSMDESSIIYQLNNNLYEWKMASGETLQLSDFRKGKQPPPKKEPTNAQRKWVKKEEQALIQVLSERMHKREASQEARKAEASTRPKSIYLEGKRMQELRLSPDKRFISYRLSKSQTGQGTKVPNYLAESGYTEELNARPKVGSPRAKSEFFIYDIHRDTVYTVKTETIPGIFDSPQYLEDYASERGDDPQKRDLLILGPRWSKDGKYAVVVIRSLDFKDRWIMLLDAESGSLKLLDHQHDEAWIDGPGISRWLGMGSIGWLADNERIWFQSEASGYSHLYTLNVQSGEKRQLTKGKYEVFNPKLSRDQQHFYFTSSEVHPGERHFYRLPIEGGKALRLTSMKGNNSVSISPDEKYLAIRYSYSNRPWELFVAPNKPKAKAKQLTQSLSEEFQSYSWRDPELVKITASDGVEVPARLYRPTQPENNGPAVIFVHGAGYLQNVHKWWSSYFREYMFHNLLADQGYTVLDIDFRASAGYGREWRRAVYRDMGGKDLSDQLDGAKFLVDNYEVDANRIGIYGGSYGGFITLMALFKHPGVFKAGAALRPVTDWAHYNHIYTASMLNEPQKDSIAYTRSSPIYHAEGLADALLICHGMIDTNVHFQGVARLAQRLIELGKDNWEVAIFPMEGHGFREPSSWTDEYKRIYKLFEQHLR